MTGGGPFEVAVAQGRLPAYLDLCADLGFDRIECGEGSPTCRLDPPAVVAHGPGARAGGAVRARQEARRRVHRGDGRRARSTEGRRWLDAGAVRAGGRGAGERRGVGLFDERGQLRPAPADRLRRGVRAGRASPSRRRPRPASSRCSTTSAATCSLCNVRLEELLRVEIYRRGLHSDAFAKPALRPAAGRRASRRSDRIASVPGPVAIDCFPESPRPLRRRLGGRRGRRHPGDHDRRDRGRQRAGAATRRRPWTTPCRSPPGWTGPLLVGELGGNMPFGFDLNNSPAALADRTDVAAPGDPALHLRHPAARRGRPGQAVYVGLPAEPDRARRPGSPAATSGWR